MLALPLIQEAWQVIKETGTRMSVFSTVFDEQTRTNKMKSIAFVDTLGFTERWSRILYAHTQDLSIPENAYLLTHGQDSCSVVCCGSSGWR